MLSWAVAVHGGAGEVEPERAGAVRRGCEQAAAAARDVLAAGGSALDAVCAAVALLEDDPEFNAGYGAALTRDGTVEVDAAVMVGAGLRAGAVAAAPGLRHPVRLARQVLAAGEHVLLSGPGALAFAREHGIFPEPDGALATEKAWRRLEAWRAGRTAAARAGGGTVGAVALDSASELAAATSTGGTTGKRPGRIGDSPIVGAGTYADEQAGACSATGHGEAILRVLLARDAIDRLRAGASAPEAAWAALHELAERTGAQAGLILVDRTGRVGRALNAPHMPFAVARAGQDQIESGLDAA